MKEPIAEAGIRAYRNYCRRNGQPVSREGIELMVLTVWRAMERKRRSLPRAQPGDIGIFQDPPRIDILIPVGPRWPSSEVER